MRDDDDCCATCNKGKSSIQAADLLHRVLDGDDGGLSMPFFGSSFCRYAVLHKLSSMNNPPTVPNPKLRPSLQQERQWTGNVNLMATVLAAAAAAHIFRPMSALTSIFAAYTSGQRDFSLQFDEIHNRLDEISQIHDETNEMLASLIRHLAQVAPPQPQADATVVPSDDTRTSRTQGLVNRIKL